MSICLKNRHHRDDFWRFLKSLELFQSFHQITDIVNNKRNHTLLRSFLSRTSYYNIWPIQIFARLFYVADRCSFFDNVSKLFTFRPASSSFFVKVGFNVMSSHFSSTTYFTKNLVHPYKGFIGGFTAQITFFSIK